MDSGNPCAGGTDGASRASCGWRQGLILGLAAVVLVHGMIASQLLVVCVRADGVTLIEVIGQDPCRHPFGEPASSCYRDLGVLARGFDDGPGPCVDLSLNRPAMAQQGFDGDTHSRMAGGAELESLQPAIYFVWPLRDVFHRLPREPARAAQKILLPASPLRI